MREESHLDDMRDAIRGDFERLAARRGEQELMRLDGQEALHEEPDQRAEPEEPLGEQTVEPESVAPETVEPESEPAPPRRSWLGRMFSP